MQINIQASGLELTDSLQNQIVRRLRFALGWAGHRLGKVSVRLSDENGPRGGQDKRCRIRVGIAGAQSLVIEDTEADLTVAIDRAAERAARVLVRRLERQRWQRSTAAPAHVTDDSNTPPIH